MRTIATYLIRRWPSVAVLSLLVVYPVADARATGETAKLDRISDVATKRGFSLDQSNEAEDWCADFLRSVLSKADIHALEPQVRAATPEDPVFDKYRVCDPSNPQRELLEKGTTFAGQFEVVTDFGHRDFRIYRFDNGRLYGEELVYGEVDWNKAYSNQGASYAIVDAAVCGYEQLINVQQAQRHEGRTLESTNLVILYRKQYYVLSMNDMRSLGQDRPWYWMELRRVDPKSPPVNSCFWTSKQ